ncbi:MAG TPA: alkaline shock response membrane anchor protein AmaP [Syntrophomonadaceae bacterium]|nr:alkaline shock response membrane anchor protein AmaP [Syntrophomonadaceae bacterium]HQE23767.1 alkaline shock response membrane anchor protein AmaP [Syntrophomonadaceae bacterium]
MSGLWRVVLFCYNLLILGLAVAAMYLAVGHTSLIEAGEALLSNSVNQIILGASAAAVIALTIVILISLLKGESKPTSIVISSSLNGQVSITVAAIKTIITKAVKKVDGVKETRSSVTNGPDGIVIYLHMMINPEISVPEMSRNVQAAVKEHLESIGGLQVSEVRVLVDDFASTNKPVTA